MDSTILYVKNKLEIQKLNRIICFEKLEIKYRASRNDFTTKYFHEKCYWIGNTLTFVESTNINIFGGFTDNQFKWAICCYPKTFIYTLVNKEN